MIICLTVVELYQKLVAQKFQFNVVTNIVMMSMCFTNPLNIWRVLCVGSGIRVM